MVLKRGKSPKRRRMSKATFERVLQLVNAKLANESAYGEDFLKVVDRNVSVGDELVNVRGNARVSLEGDADLSRNAEELAETPEEQLVLAIDEDEDLAVKLLRTCRVDTAYRFSFSSIPDKCPRIDWPHKPWVDATFLHVAIVSGAPARLIASLNAR
jgi:hypothetical protein